MFEFSDRPPHNCALTVRLCELCKISVSINLCHVTLTAGRGNWSAEGCTARSVDNRTGLITCACNHLTNFAILVVSSHGVSVLMWVNDQKLTHKLEKPEFQNQILFYRISMHELKDFNLTQACQHLPLQVLLSQW